MLAHVNSTESLCQRSRAIQRVLVVDDSRLQRRILAGVLGKWGFDVVEADSGEDAIQKCRSQLPDLVLSDWMMPGMNGLEFCRAFRDMTAGSYGYFILLTSKSEKNEIAQGLDAGADDFLTKPINTHELRARISAGDRIMGMQKELSAKNRLISETLDQLQAAYDTIDNDLIQAKKIQESLVPRRMASFDGSCVSLLLKPCGHIGGDLVGVFSPSSRSVGFYAIDVSGHGITSALMTARLGGYLSGEYHDQNIAMQRMPDGRYVLRPPDEVACLLNERLTVENGIDQYFTMAYGVADLDSGMVQIVQAGHPHPLVLRTDGSAEFIGDGGMPIGLLKDAQYSRFEVAMEPGDKLLFYSDGFTECRLENGQMLESDGMLALFEESLPALSGLNLLDDVFCKLTGVISSEHGLEDDVSGALFEFARS